MAAEIIATVKAVGAKTIEGIKKTALDGNEVKEVKSNEFSELVKRKETLEPDIEKAKSSSLESILQENKERLQENQEVRGEPESNERLENKNVPDEGAEESDDGSEGLTDEEKQKIKEETGWSDEIINSVRSMEEYEIYKKASLKEVEIGEKKALIRNDIDWNQVDEKGRTNAERIKKGLAPLDKDGNPIGLHHIGQREDSPLAELTFKEHRCDGNDTILHDKIKETETHGEGNTWVSQRQDYWKTRAEYNKEPSNLEGGEK